jgi:dihydrodipicolinate synthase/N-acetylneuraminate lyase
MLGAKDLRGVYAIIPTPSKEGADRLDAVDTVDLDETARLVNRLIEDGVSGLIALGTTGECATLSPKDYQTFVDCLLATVNRRIPTFVGTTALGAHEVASRIRFVQEQGADGTLLGIPMWQPATLDGAVQYYAAVSELFPSFAVMVYANSRAFRFPFGPDFWKGVAQRAPTVMSAKFSNAGMLLDALAASEGRINFVPNDGAVYRFATISPETTTACWATSASMGPQPSIAVMEAILARDMSRAKEVADDIAWAGEPTHPIIGDPEIFASYNIQVEKIRFDAAGYCKAGPIRPPYNVMPDDYAEAARENGRRWVQLCAKYARSKARAGAQA